MRPALRNTVCALATVGVLAAISPPRLPAEQAQGAGRPVPPAAGAPGPLGHTLLMSGGMPAGAARPRAFAAVTTGTPPALRTARSLRPGGLRIGPAGVGPGLAECVPAAGAPALGHTNGPLACAQPIRGVLARW